MVLKKDAILTLIKSITPTMEAAGFELTSPKKPGEDDEDLVFSGKLGNITIKAYDQLVELVCQRDGEGEHSIAKILFDFESEGWEVKDCKSTANELAETVSRYFGTPLVYESQENKKNDKNKNDKSGKNSKDESAPRPKKKNRKRDSVLAYEAINLANRMENIYPEIKGEIDKNIADFGLFLPDEYFEKVANPLILESIRKKDRQTMKKLFNAFNIFYDEGTKDVQSLVAVSILGINFVKEPELLDNCSSLMADELEDAVVPIMTYLKTPSGKSKIKAFENPNPYKGKGKKR